MHEITVAETLLALFTSPIRAREVSGDLAEERRSRGRIWFWAALSGTVVRFLWHDIRRSAAVLLPLVALGVFFNFVSRAFIAPEIFRYAASTIGDSPTTAWILAGIVWGRIVAPFLAAMVLAKLARGHEVTVGIVFAVSGYWAQILLTNSSPSSGPEFIGLSLIPIASVLATSVLMRRVARRHPLRS